MYIFIDIIEGMKPKWISVTSVIFIKYYSGYLIFDILYTLACNRIIFECIKIFYKATSVHNNSMEII